MLNNHCYFVWNMMLIDSNLIQKKKSIYLRKSNEWKKCEMVFSDLIYQYWKKSKSSNVQCSRFITLHEICGSDLMVVCISMPCESNSQGILIYLENAHPECDSTMVSPSFTTNTHPTRTLQPSPITVNTYTLFTMNKISQASELDYWRWDRW